MAEIPQKDKVELTAPPRLVTLQLGTPWNLVAPTVFRYEDERWINAFFQTGELRISTLERFTSYADEIRGDKQEGIGFGYGETPDRRSVSVMAGEAMKSLVLSCSHRLDHSLREAFGRESAFQIVDTVGFAAEIARRLPGFRGGYEGSCRYRTDTSIRRAIQFDVEKYRLPTGEMDMQMLFDTAGVLGGPERVLLKRKSYEAQQEYRFVWHLDPIDADYCDIKAPQARQFCRRVVPSDYD